MMVREQPVGLPTRPGRRGSQRRGTGCCRVASGIVVGSLFHQVKPSPVHLPAGPENPAANDRLSFPCPLLVASCPDPQARTILSICCTQATMPAKSRQPALEGQTGSRLAVSRACRSMQDELNGPPPLCPARRRALPSPLATQHQIKQATASASAPAHGQRASLPQLPSNGETSSKCWRYNPKGVLKREICFMGTDGMRCDPSQGGILGSARAGIQGPPPDLSPGLRKGTSHRKWEGERKKS